MANKIKTPKYVYFFGDNKADGNESMKNLLGGKGANLAEMAGHPNLRAVSYTHLDVYKRQGEIVPVWSPSSKFSISLHVLQAAGLDENAVQRSLFVALQPRFPHLGLSKNYFLSYFPQFFYLELDDKNGSYFSHTLNLNKSNFPFAISSVFTYKFKSTIPGDDIVWNIGLNLKL